MKGRSNPSRWSWCKGRTLEPILNQGFPSLLLPRWSGSSGICSRGTPGVLPDSLSVRVRERSVFKAVWHLAELAPPGAASTSPIFEALLDHVPEFFSADCARAVDQ